MKILLRTLLIATAVMSTACKPAQPSAEYLAICEGAPLSTIERRNQAMEDGYEIDRGNDCITKRSAKLMAEQKAQWEAANTPQAKAERQAAFERSAAEGKVRMQAQAAAEAQARAEREQQWAAAEQAPIAALEINSASAEQLSSLQGLGSEVAQQIVQERGKSRFKNWNDVIGRIVGLSAAETAVRASAFGLTVNGHSLAGAERDSAIAKYARDKWRRRDG